jgi:hypothetical protein
MCFPKEVNLSVVMQLHIIEAKPEQMDKLIECIDREFTAKRQPCHRKARREIRRRKNQIRQVRTPR